MVETFFGFQQKPPFGDLPRCQAVVCFAVLGRRW